MAVLMWEFNFSQKIKRLRETEDMAEKCTWRH